MVERLKAAIEKARERRGSSGLVEASPAEERRSMVTGAAPDRASRWAALTGRELDPRLLRSRRVSNADRDPRVNQPFDLLRTRLLKLCAEHGWRRVGVTSPTKGCGKTTLCVNLAFSLARHPSAWTIVMDLDLRAPNLSRTLGLEGDADLVAFLEGAVGYEAALARAADRLAFGPNTRAVLGSAELLHDPTTERAVAGMIEALEPTIVLLDLPPLLAGDETLGFSDRVDAILLVAAAGVTTASHIEECDRLLAGAAPIAGVVLNKSEAAVADSYQYEYAPG